MTYHIETDEAFNGWLRRRRMPDTPRGLTSRIITAALHADARRTFSLSDWLQDFWQDILPLRPAYAFASILLLGFVLGATGAPLVDSPTPQTVIAEEGVLP